MKLSEKIAQFLLPSLKDMLFIAVFISAIRTGPAMLNADGDLGHHLAMGRLILNTGEIPAADPFSFRTEGKLAIPHEWLAQVIFAGLDSWLGLNGVVIFSALMIALAFALTFQESLKRSQMTLVAFIFTILAAAASSIHWITRPHLITFVLLGIWLYNLESLWRGEPPHFGGEHRRWWLFPLLALVWANLHGMFVMGLVTWSIYLAGYLAERIRGDPSDLRSGLGRDLTLAGLTSIPVTLLTPSGWHIWESIFNLVGSETITRLTSEYRSADFQQVGSWPFLILLGLTLFGLAQSRNKLSLPQTLSLAAWFGMALYSARFIPLAAIAVTPIVAEAFFGWLSACQINKFHALNSRLAKVNSQLKAHLWPAISVFVIILLLNRGIDLDVKGQGNRFDPGVFPVQAVDWLKTNPVEGNMFNDFDWGGYLLYRLWPHQKIFMDGHTHIYGEELTREYVTVAGLDKGWEEILDKYRVRWVIMPSGSALVRALGDDPSWTVIYADPTATILRRK